MITSPPRHIWSQCKDEFYERFGVYPIHKNLTSDQDIWLDKRYTQLAIAQGEYLVSTGLARWEV